MHGLNRYRVSLVINGEIGIPGLAAAGLALVIIAARGRSPPEKGRLWLSPFRETTGTPSATEKIALAWLDGPLENQPLSPPENLSAKPHSVQLATRRRNILETGSPKAGIAETGSASERTNSSRCAVRRTWSRLTSPGSAFSPLKPVTGCFQSRDASHREGIVIKSTVAVLVDKGSDTYVLFL